MAMMPEKSMNLTSEAHAKRSLAYLVTEDWYFLSHRLPMATAAQRAGFEVHVITQVNEGRHAIEALGFRLHAVRWRRGSVNPFHFLFDIRAVRRIYRVVCPDLVHHVGLQSSIVGSLAAAGSRFIRLNALTGLGFVFASANRKARGVRKILRMFLRYVLNHPRAAVLVQNADDRLVVLGLGIDPDKVFTIAGSGVDTDRLRPLIEPAGAIKVGFVGRLLEDKGVRTLVAAHRLLIQRGLPIGLLIAGQPDPANPASIPESEIESWRKIPNIQLLGHVEDIRSVWAAAHIAVLPSRREGLPKSLLEAAACGRPIVASDVPGCRVIARAGINALLAPPDDAAALAAAIDQLARDPAMRRLFGEAGRRLAVDEFSSERIGQETVALYRLLLDRALAGVAL
jgi:glycosyltransferase involved in cell wall biosynthesis